jgi:hypothetical protein
VFLDQFERRKLVSTGNPEQVAPGHPVYKNIPTYNTWTKMKREGSHVAAAMVMRRVDLFCSQMKNSIYTKDL